MWVLHLFEENCRKKQDTIAIVKESETKDSLKADCNGDIIDAGLDWSRGGSTFTVRMLICLPSLLLVISSDQFGKNIAQIANTTIVTHLDAYHQLETNANTTSDM